VVNFRSAKDLKAFDENAEREHSRRYWSSDHPECCSWAAMKKRLCPAVGEIAYDPRTYHVD
jgi:hypothetical protein